MGLNQQTPTFDLTLERPMEKLQFGQIRLPYGLHMVLPLKGDLLLSAKSAANLITANTLLPVCKVEGKALETFDNRTLPLTIDPCYHLVAADCSIHGKFSVQARKVPASGQKDLKVIVGKTMIDIISVPNAPIEVRMDRQPAISVSVIKTEKTVYISAPLHGLQSQVFEDSNWPMHHLEIRCPQETRSNLYLQKGCHPMRCRLPTIPTCLVGKTNSFHLFEGRPCS